MPLCLPARIDGERATRAFSRPRLANWFGLLAPKTIRIASPGDPSSRVPPFVERIWMPAYAVGFVMLARGSRSTVWTTVDGGSGQFALLDRVDELVEKETAGDRFPPVTSEEDAARLARRGLLQIVLRGRGQLGKASIEDVAGVKLYYYPVWVLYRRRGRGALDLTVLDGYTGTATGAKVRIAVLNAFIADRKVT